MKLHSAIISTLFIGILLYFGAVLGLFAQSAWLAAMSIFAIISFAMSSQKKQLSTKNSLALFQTTFLEKILLTLLLLGSLSHAVQVFVPETGFDAVWYHLPVAVGVIQHNGLYYSPQLYQSVNPPFSDLFFTAGYFFAGELGAKITAYFFYLAFICSFYALSRVYISRTKALALTLLVSLFQVVSWQAASFYIDVAKAFWEMSLLWMLVTSEPKMQKHKYYWIGLLLGASVATKQFSLLLIPLILILVWMQSKSIKKCVDVFVFAAAVVLPHFVFTFLYTGSLFVSTMLHIDKLQEIGGSATIWAFASQKLMAIWQLPFALFVARDYVFPPQAFVFIAAALMCWKKNIRSTSLTVHGVFSGYYYLLWWFIPPLSTRYALTGLSTSLIFVVVVFENQLSKYRRTVVSLFFLLIIGMFVPRLFVNARSLTFLLGFQDKKQYLQQFLDTNIDTPLMRWHSDVFVTLKSE